MVSLRISSRFAAAPVRIIQSRLIRGDDNFRMPQHFIVEHVTLVDLLDDRMRGNVASRNLEERVVEMRIEGLAERVEWARALRLENSLKLLVDELHSPAKGSLRCPGWGILLVSGSAGHPERPLKVVHNGEELQDQVLVRKFDDRGIVVFDALLIVLELGCFPQQLIFILPDAFLQLRDPGAEHVDLAQLGDLHRSFLTGPLFGVIVACHRYSSLVCLASRVVHEAAVPQKSLKHLKLYEFSGSLSR